MFACPICQENVNGVTNLRIYITCCKSDPIEVRVKRSIGSPSSITSLEESSKDFQMINLNLQQPNKSAKPIWPKILSKIKIEKVDQVPVNTDGLKHYRVKHENASVLIAKSRDGRKFKNITIAKILRQFFIQIAIDLCIAQILTGFICKSKAMYFDKKSDCDICSGGGIFNACEASFSCWLTYWRSKRCM